MRTILKIRPLTLLSFYIFLMPNSAHQLKWVTAGSLILFSLHHLIFICTWKISLLAWIGFWIGVLLTGARVYSLAGASCANGLFYLENQAQSWGWNAYNLCGADVTRRVQHQLLGKKVPHGTHPERLSALSVPSFQELQSQAFRSLGS